MKRIYERELEPFRRAKENLQYGAAIVGGMAYRGSQLFHSSSRPTKKTYQTDEGDQDQTWKEDAHLAKAAYTSSPVEGYTIDPDFTYGNITVYKNDKSGKAKVAFAGTRGFKDAKADIAILGGFEQKDPQFRQALDTTRKVINKYGIENVSATGHSLGGTKTTYVSSKLGIHGTTFNQGWGAGAFTHATSLGDKWDTSKVKDYVVPGDLISTATSITPGRNVTKIHQEDKLQKMKGMFKTKGMEALTRTSIPEMVAGIPMLGTATGLAYGAYGAYKVGKAQYDLHKMDNFIQPTRPPSVRTHEDRVETRKQNIKHTDVSPVPTTQGGGNHTPVPINANVPVKPITPHEKSHAKMPAVWTPGDLRAQSAMYSFGNHHVHKHMGTRHKKTKVSRRRPRHAMTG